MKLSRVRSLLVQVIAFPTGAMAGGGILVHVYLCGHFAHRDSLLLLTRPHATLSKVLPATYYYYHYFLLAGRRFLRTPLSRRLCSKQIVMCSLYSSFNGGSVLFLVVTVICPLVPIPHSLFGTSLRFTGDGPIGIFESQVRCR